MKNFSELTFAQQKRNIIFYFILLGLLILSLLCFIGYAILSSDLAFSIPIGVTWQEYFASIIGGVVIFLGSLLVTLFSIVSLSEIRYSYPQGIFAGGALTYASLIFLIATQLYHPGRYIMYQIFFIYNF